MMYQLTQGDTIQRLSDNAYIPPDVGQELALCQRYYQHHLNPMLRGVWATVSNPERSGMVLPVQMRAAPTITHTSVGASGAAKFYDGSVSAGTITSMTNTYSRNSSIEFGFTTSLGTYTVGRAACLYEDSNFVSLFAVSAEL